MQLAIACYYLSTLQIELVPLIICGLTARFLEYYSARCDIPRPDPTLVVPVKPSYSHLAKFEHSRA